MLFLVSSEMRLNLGLHWYSAFRKYWDYISILNLKTVLTKFLNGIINNWFFFQQMLAKGTVCRVVNVHSFCPHGEAPYLRSRRVQSIGMENQKDNKAAGLQGTQAFSPRSTVCRTCKFLISLRLNLFLYKMKIKQKFNINNSHKVTSRAKYKNTKNDDTLVVILLNTQNIHKFRDWHIESIQIFTLRQETLNTISKESESTRKYTILYLNPTTVPNIGSYHLFLHFILLKVELHLKIF